MAMFRAGLRGARVLLEPSAPGVIGTDTINPAIRQYCATSRDQPRKAARQDGHHNLCFDL